jgi:D-lactate dehydrogenase
MKTAVFSTKPYDREFLERANESAALDLTFFEARLMPQTVKLAEGFESVCVFVNDRLDASVLIALKKIGVRHIALRCAGFNNVDIAREKDVRPQNEHVPVSLILTD